MQDIIERLQILQNSMSNETFLSNKGLSNEVGLYVFAYRPEEEMVIRQFLRLISAAKNENYHPIVYDLYDILLEICRKRRILDRIAQMETLRGTEQILGQIQRIAPPEAYVEHMKYENHCYGDVVMITGVGRVFPYMRSHNILNNLQHVFDDIPVILFYPGEYNGQTLTLFGEFADDNYYRAFNLV